jgi:hypothetical protein
VCKTVAVQRLLAAITVLVQILYMFPNILDLFLLATGGLNLIAGRDQNGFVSASPKTD